MHFALVLMVLSQGPDEVTLLNSAGLAHVKTVEQCVALYKAAKKTLPTAYIRGTSMEAADCTRRVMNASLDKVLVPLKKTDAVRFKLGMQAQAAFNTGVKRYCGRWEKYYADCCSTCSLTEQPECEMDFHAARVVPMDATGPATRTRITAEFGEFAKSWCQFEGDASETCPARILASLEAHQRDDGRELKCGK